MLSFVGFYYIHFTKRSFLFLTFIVVKGTYTCYILYCCCLYIGTVETFLNDGLFAYSFLFAYHNRTRI